MALISNIQHSPLSPGLADAHLAWADPHRTPFVNGPVCCDYYSGQLLLFGYLDPEPKIFGRLGPKIFGFFGQLGANFRAFASIGNGRFG